MDNWYTMTMKADKTAEVFIYKAIGPRLFSEESVEAGQFAKDLREIQAKKPKEILVRINSPGGNVADGTAIYNLLHEIQDLVICQIDGMAASMASIVALAGRETRMAKNALFMVHSPRTFAVGDEDTMLRAAALLKTSKQALMTAYTEKTGRDEGEISAAMDKETWYTAEEAEAFGYVDTITDEQPVAASAEFTAWLEDYQHVPDDMAARLCATAEIEDGPEAGETKEGIHMPEEKKEGLPAPATLQELKDSLPGASAEFLIGQLEAGATVVEALKAHTAAQSEALTAKDTEIAEAKAEAEKVKAQAETTMPGNDALGTSNLGSESGTADAEAAYKEQVEKTQDARRCERHQAVRIVNKQYPELREAYVAAVNERR